MERGDLERGHWPDGMALLAILAWAIAFRSGPYINDAAWQLWIGRQLNHGARLYVDILEVNPPLWFWVGALVEGAARLLGIASRTGLLVGLAVAACVSLALCRRLSDDPGERALVYTALILTLFLTSPFALGQREQFTFLAAVPYLLLVARRAEGKTVGMWVALSVGLFAAPGFALKHYFALVPLALEAWLAFRLRAFQLRPELVALGASAAAYLLAILWFTPEYVTVMVPLIRAVYRGYDLTVADLLKQPGLFVALLAVSALVLRRSKLAALPSAASVVALAFAATYLLQGKGFPYHAVPALGAGLLALFAGYGRLREAPRASVAMALLALLMAGAAPFAAGAARYDQAAAKATASLRPGAAITMLSASGVAAWPLVEERGLGWNSRHMMLWMLGPAWKALHEGRVEPALQQLTPQVRSEVAAEIACSQPDLVLIDKRYDVLIPRGDLLSFFAADAGFARAMRDYRRAPDVDYLEVYRRVERRPASACAPPPPYSLDPRPVTANARIALRGTVRSNGT